jgi:hypothetical protein
MKHLFFVTTLFILVSCTSCNNNNANAAGNKDDAATGNTTSSASSDNAVFSYNLDGAKISGGEVDATQTNNIVMITKNDNSEKFSFFLGDAYQENSETFAHSLRFTIPGKTGTVILKPDDDNGSVELFLGNDKDDKYVLYGNEGFSITVTNISATRVSGTFSGQLKLVDGTGAGKSELTVTDGKFDIPIRNTK